MLDNLKRYRVVLASNSPRRKLLLSGLDIPFEVKVLPDIDESYPHDLPLVQVAEYIAREKAAAYKPLMGRDELIITADTIVIAAGEVMGKPKDADDARRMLGTLSDRTHQVVTGVCIMTAEQQRSFSAMTDVTSKRLTEEEIEYYLGKYKPYDKAGAYGVQEWIGYIGVSAINGSFYNVMGFPIQRIYNELASLPPLNGTSD